MTQPNTKCKDDFQSQVKLNTMEQPHRLKIYMQKEQQPIRFTIVCYDKKD